MSTTTKAERLKQKQEQDAVLGRVSIALARSQRLIDSWLPAPGHEDSEEEDEQEDDQIWGGLPDGVGLGGQPKGDGLANGQSGLGGQGGELDRLRKQLIGKKALGKTGLAAGSSRTSLTASKPMNGDLANMSKDARDDALSKKRREQDEDDGEEQGRSASFKSKKHKVDKTSKVHPAVLALQNGAGAASTVTQDKEAQEEQQDEAETQKAEPKRGMSYLDQVLAERSEKKKKKKKKKKKRASEQNGDHTGD